MKNYQLHTENNHLLSRSCFLKKEIDFLIKLVQKEYSLAMNSSKSDMLDCYWEMLEKVVEKWSMLTLSIKKNEKETDPYSSIYSNLGSISIQKERAHTEIKKITQEIRTIKESLMEFLRKAP